MDNQNLKNLIFLKALYSVEQHQQSGSSMKNSLWSILNEDLALNIFNGAKSIAFYIDVLVFYSLFSFVIIFLLACTCFVMGNNSSHFHVLIFMDVCSLRRWKYLLGYSTKSVEPYIWCCCDTDFDPGLLESFISFVFSLQTFVY